MKEIIKTQELSFHYDREDLPPEPVLKNINLFVKQGEFVAVLGHNGSGKSTLAKHFNAILIPSSGNVTVAGMDTKDDSKIYEIRSEVGMVFQNPDNQLVATVVEEDVAFALENLGIAPPEIRRRVDEAMEMVGVYDYRERAPHQLSGGQKQRVAIAGIIAMRPHCIVLDEPTAMLDPKGRKQVMKTISMLNKEHGITIVLITHYMDEAVKADRVVVVDEGRIFMSGTPKEVFSHVDELKSVGLDVPQVTELAFELGKAGFSIDQEILTDEEFIEAVNKLLEE